MSATPILSEGCRLLREYRGSGPARVRMWWIAERLGCEEEHVRLLLHGRRTPGLELAVALEELCGIPPRAWTKRAMTQQGVGEDAVRAADVVPTIRSEVAE